MIEVPHRRISPTLRAVNRNRVQLGGGLIFGAALPAAFLHFSTLRDFDPGLFQQTLAGITAAILIGYYLLRNLVVFPGIRTSYYIMPSFLASFAIILAFFFFLRLDYSRGAFLGSFFCTLFWYYLIDLLGQRRDLVKIGVIPFGDIASLAEVDQVRWQRLRAPELDQRYDALVADLRADIPDEWEAFISECAIAGIAVFHVKQLRESLTGKVEIEHLSENSFGSLVPFMAYLRLRRLADFVLAAVIGALLLPFLLLIGLMIRLNSPGPALFRQRRMGYRGRPFWVAKFRTMGYHRTGDDCRDRAMTKEGDPRITSLGRFLRRTRIDELPQIWNILRGEMSWIGPRPEAEVLSSWYERELPFYRYRHIVPPGITGWAQVNQGHVAHLDQVIHKLHYDFYYIKNFSPWLDVLILIRTVRTVFTGFGSK